MNCQILNVERKGLVQVDDKYKIHDTVKTNLALFKLLSEPLQLHEECIEFTLNVQAGKLPTVEQTYYCSLDDMPKNIIKEMEAQEE